MSPAEPSYIDPAQAERLTEAAHQRRTYRQFAAAALVVLLILTWWRCGEALTRSWCCDDMAILAHAWQYSPWQYFARPEVWGHLSTSNLTPMLSLSFDVDLALVGFRPRVFHAHQLLSIALSAWMMFLLMCRWCPKRVALVWASVFLMGASVVQAGELLMERHYVEGLGWTLLTLWLSTRPENPSTQRHRWLWDAAAMLACMLALASKEVYVPVVVMPLILCAGTWRHRLRRAAPLLVVLGLYAAWRWAMLSGFVGGYVDPHLWRRQDGVVTAQLMAALPGLMWEWPALILALATATALTLWWRSAHKLWGLAAGLVVAGSVLLPLVPLTVYPGLVAGNERYVYLLWAVFVMALGVGLHKSWAHRPMVAWAATLGGAALCVATSWPTAQAAQAQVAHIHQGHSSVFRLMAGGTDDEVFLASPKVPSLFASHVAQLRAAAKWPGQSRVLADVSVLASALPLPMHVWRYDDAQAKLVDEGTGLDAYLHTWRKRLSDEQQKVEVSYDTRSHMMRWSLSAPEPGSHVVLAKQGPLVLPDQGSMRMVDLPECLQFRHDLADGRMAYSPWLKFDKRSSARWTIQWQGPGLDFDALTTVNDCLK